MICIYKKDETKDEALVIGKVKLRQNADVPDTAQGFRNTEVRLYQTRSPQNTISLHQTTTKMFTGLVETIGSEDLFCSSRYFILMSFI